MSRTNYIYVDYENVREVDLDLIANKPVKVILAVGPHVKNLPLALFEQALKYASQVRLLKSVTTGKNALDLLIATDLGEERNRDPEGFFHIFSKDRDFDSVIMNLRAQGTLIERRESLSAVPVLMNAGERLILLKERLSALNGSRPKSREGLEKCIQGHFNQSLSLDEVAHAVNGLIKAKVFTMDAGGMVIYPKVSPKAAAPVQLVLEMPAPATSKPVISNPAPAAKQKPLPGLEERVKKVREALARVPKNRPSRVASLRAFIHEVFRQDVPDGAMNKTIKALVAAKVLTVNAVGRVEYPE